MGRVERTSVFLLHHQHIAATATNPQPVGVVCCNARGFQQQGTAAPQMPNQRAAFTRHVQHEQHVVEPISDDEALETSQRAEAQVAGTEGVAVRWKGDVRAGLRGPAAEEEDVVVVFLQRRDDPAVLRHVQRQRFGGEGHVADLGAGDDGDTAFADSDDHRPEVAASLLVDADVESRFELGVEAVLLLRASVGPVEHLFGRHVPGLVLRALRHHPASWHRRQTHAAGQEPVQLLLSILRVQRHDFTRVRKVVSEGHPHSAFLGRAQGVDVRLRVSEAPEGQFDRHFRNQRDLLARHRVADEGEEGVTHDGVVLVVKDGEVGADRQTGH